MADVAQLMPIDLSKKPKSISRNRRPTKNPFLPRTTRYAMGSTDLYADLEPPIFALNVSDNLEHLSADEKLYAHHMSFAAYHGTRILLRQVSPESETIFDLVMEVARWCRGDWKLLSVVTKVSFDLVQRFLEYAAAFLDSLGNYRGYGDRKILPRIPLEEFQNLCSVSARAKDLFKKSQDGIFSPTPECIGYPDAGGMSAYYPTTLEITKQEIEEVSKFLLGKGVLLQNTRLRKNDTSPQSFDVLVASVKKPSSTAEASFELSDANTRIKVLYGDHADALSQVCGSITSALEYVRNDDRALYLRKLLEYFQTGSVQSQKEGSVAWLKDASPPVEVVIGFMEPYRDPSAIRREWMGLVAIQNEEQTRVFNLLAHKAEDFIRDMPWAQQKTQDGKTNVSPFENEHFIRPDLASLDILSFCVSNCWTGITGPGFPEVRAAHGRKNIYFSNRASAVNMSSKVPFIPPSDLDDYCKLRGLGFTTIVAVHELIGHGCGKILEETSPGLFNFDRQNLPISPLNQEQITTWYKPGETPKSVFGGTYTVLNECLAESIALYLIPNKDLQDLIGVSTIASHETFTYHVWLQMISMGLKALLSYDAASQKWGQSHDRARFGIVKRLSEAGEGLLDILISQDALSGNPELEIHLKRDLIPTIGRTVLRDLILHLQIYRCTADVLSGREYMESLTTVDGIYERWRDAVILKRQKRPLFVQANTVLGTEGGQVSLREYPATKEGLIWSWVERDI